MITYVPKYYRKFKCIADKCQHTCCKGWEIDVDSDSLTRYESHPEIMDKIEGGSYVLQGDEERCPFLRSDNLCQMIIDHGEDFICDICKDHPRFRNFYDDRVEMGLGLCCEAAVDVVLDNRDEFELVPNRELTDTLNILNRFSVDLFERFNLIASIVLDSKESVSMYQGMEVLDNKWSSILDAMTDDYVDSIEDLSTNLIRDNSKTFEQVALYYAYRYPKIPDFCVEACRMIARVAVHLGGTVSDIKEATRMYSSEVEYSDENMDVIYEVFGDL